MRLFALYTRLTRDLRLTNKDHQANFTHTACRNKNKLDFIWSLTFETLLPKWSFSCHGPLDNLFSHLLFYHVAGWRRLVQPELRIQFWRLFLLTERSPSFCHQAPPARHSPSWKPFDVSLHTSPSKLWNLNFLIRATSICQEILFLHLTEIELRALQ